MPEGVVEQSRRLRKIVVATLRAELMSTAKNKNSVIQIGRDFTAAPVDAMALDALLAFEQLFPALRIARNQISRQPGTTGTCSGRYTCIPSPQD